MPRNKVSNDLDHVRKDPKPSTTPKGRPPTPWPLPTYVPLKITNARTHGQGHLPKTVASDDPYAIFSLFFNDEAIQTLVRHTNEYAFQYPGPGTGRPWFPTTVKEFRAYLGVSIWMGLHIESSIPEFWNVNPLNGPIHEQVSKHISLTRWQQIDRFFHISEPHPPGHKQERPFVKLEPLSDTLRQAFKKYWKSGTHLAVDETIQRFMGRSAEIVNIPSKPTPEGFKIWVLANEGYILDWMYHAKGSNKTEGPQDLCDFWTKDLGFNQTQAVVLDLVTQEGIARDHSHIIWLDNLFTSARLLSQLDDEGFGAAGTVRTTATSREELEAKEGTKAQKKSQEPNRGLDQQLVDLKIKWNSALEWGQLYGSLSSDGKVMQFAWKDQNVVLFMSTVSDPRDTISRLRRRPAKTATNARTSRTPFGEESTKVMDIPAFIDMYNHYMNGVDNADQLRCYYSTQRVHFKNWKPLWHFLLDITIVNCFKIHYCMPKKPYQSRIQYSRREFRTKLASQLLEHSERICGKPTSIKASLSCRVHPAAPREHGSLERIGDRAKRCVVCSIAGRKVEKVVQIRKPLSELSINAGRTLSDVRKRPKQIPRGLFGCKLCGIAICNHIGCWKEHLEAIPYR